MSFSVFYYNPNATDDVHAAIRSELPAGWRLTTPGAGPDFSRELASCDFILVADRAITIADLCAAPRLRMIQHQGVGYEKIDLAACRARGIPVALTPEGTTTGVAEHTLLLILALYKQLPTAANAVRAGRWPQWELRATSHEISGKTLGLVGFGRIGREVGRRAAAFDAHVIYFDPFMPDTIECEAERMASLSDLLHSSDIVSLHLPLTETSRNLVNAHSLSQMKHGAILINTSRGELIDEAALAAALDAGHLAGAGLDVLANEPPALGHPLVRRANVLVTPHISAGTRDALATKMRAAFANMLRQTRGEPLNNLVSPAHATTVANNG